MRAKRPFAISRVADALIALDRTLIDFCEALYLWCFDRTGISLGTAYTILMLSIPLARGLLGLSAWVDLSAVAALAVVVGRVVAYGQTQMSGEAWNCCVELFRVNRWRQIGFALVALGTLSVSLFLLVDARPDGPVLLALPLAFYLFLARLRERRPPPKKSHRPALGRP